MNKRGYHVKDVVCVNEIIYIERVLNYITGELYTVAHWNVGITSVDVNINMCTK